jgi:hypothetical protein
MNANITKWTSTVITLFGAMATVLKYDPLNIYLLNMGALGFLFWGIQIRDKAMITVNLGMLLIYVFGLYIRV